MRLFSGHHEFVEPFIEHQGELRRFWLRKPRAVGERILLARKGFPVPVSQQERTIVFLEIGSAFGTGGHGTTEGCLLALEKCITGGETVLDVGTGTGILAVAARKLGAGPVTAIDVDGAACREAERNIAANGIEGEIEVIAGDIGSVDGRFDIVVANLRTPLLVELLDELVKKQKPRGITICSGVMERELHPFLALVDHSPLAIMEIRRVRGWTTLVLSGEPKERRKGVGGQNSGRMTG